MTDLVEGFAVQDALARNDRKALAKLARCTCTEDQVDFDFNNDCPARVWDGCRSDLDEDWRDMNSVGSDWAYERDLDTEYPDRTEDIPDEEDLAACVAALTKACPTGWEACWIPAHGWYASDLTAAVCFMPASERVFVLEIVTLDERRPLSPHYENLRRLQVTVRSTALDEVIETLGLIPLPARTYFTAAWIVRVLQPLFLKYHP